MLKELVKRPGRRTGVCRGGIGFLDLPEDLGLTDHHGIKAAGHPEEMPYSLGRGMVVQGSF